MTQSKQLPLLFTPSNRAAIRQGGKTHTRRVKGLEEVVADEAVWDGVHWEWDFYLDGHWRASHRCPYGNPQVEPVGYWVREPVEILHPGDFTNQWTLLVKWLDDADQAWVAATLEDIEAIANRARGWEVPTTALHMLKSFARTWLKGKRTWPEKLGDITPEASISEGIELCPTVAASWDSIKTRARFADRPAWRDYLKGGYDLFPKQSYASLWESIYGEGSWNPEQWVWCVEWEVKP